MNSLTEAYLLHGCTRRVRRTAISVYFVHCRTPLQNAGLWFYVFRYLRVSTTKFKRDVQYMDIGQVHWLH